MQLRTRLRRNDLRPRDLVQAAPRQGLVGPRIARAIAKSEGYVNNLIRVVERASPSLLLRWRAEQTGMLEHVCATDWLVAVCLLPHPIQDRELDERIQRFRLRRSPA